MGRLLLQNVSRYSPLSFFYRFNYRLFPPILFFSSRILNEPPDCHTNGRKCTTLTVSCVCKGAGGETCTAVVHLCLALVIISIATSPPTPPPFRSIRAVPFLIRYFGKRPVIQPAYVIREESLLPEADLTNLQKKRAGPEAILIVCKACAENCFVPGRVSFHTPALRSRWRRAMASFSSGWSGDRYGCF